MEAAAMKEEPVSSKTKKKRAHAARKPEHVITSYSDFHALLVDGSAASRIESRLLFRTTVVALEPAHRSRIAVVQQTSQYSLGAKGTGARRHQAACTLDVPVFASFLTRRASLRLIGVEISSRAAVVAN